MKNGQLHGYRVLDLTRVLAGPWTCQILGDLGAEVIKVERPGDGDGSRLYGPPFLKDENGAETKQSPMYLSANRNKKSVSIDISTKEGQDLIRRLAAKSDVFVENYKVGDLKRYGLDYKSIKAVNPGIIYCSITGFGQTGPYRTRLGYDPIFQAMSGLMHATGHPDGHPGDGPMKVGPSISDVIGGLFAGVGILSALLKRQRDGTGDHIDISLLDTAVASMSHLAMSYLMSGEAPQRHGTSSNGGVPGQAYRCADGDILITCGNDQQYYRMCEVLDRPDLAASQRYRTQRDRLDHRGELVGIVSDLVSKRDLQGLLAALEAAQVPAAPIYDLADVFRDPQVRARGMAVDVPNPFGGDLSLVANPIRFSENPITRYEFPPQVGENSEDVLSGLLGIGRDEIDRLIAAGVAGRP